MCSVWCVFNFTHKLHRLGSTGSYTLPPKPKKRRLSFWKSSKGKSQYHQNTTGGKLLGCRRELNWVPNDWGKLRKSFYFFVVILSGSLSLVVNQFYKRWIGLLSTNVGLLYTVPDTQKTFVEIMSLQRLYGVFCGLCHVLKSLDSWTWPVWQHTAWYQYYEPKPFKDDQIYLQL